jgi:hypothetical protein
MSLAFIALVVLHALLHLLGVAKAFSLVALPQLTQQISPAAGLLWLAASLLLFAAAFAYYAAPRWWWAPAIAGVALSQVAIAGSWGDAWAGTIVNVLILLGALYGFASQGPTSFQAAFDRESDALFAHTSQPPLLTESDIAHLPKIVQRYVHESGAVGRPRVRNFHVRFKGRIRGAADRAWMPFTAEQYSYIEQPARLFLMRARRSGLPVQAFHRAVGQTATMQVKLLALVSVVDARGPEMDIAESVTILNDLCVLAPGALIDPRIRWEEIGERMVRASFTNGEQTVSGDLVFNDRAELVNFISEDRFHASADGRTMTRMRWTTPLRAYYTYSGGIRVASQGEARWHEGDADWAYGDFKLVKVEYNVRRR